MIQRLLLIALAGASVMHAPPTTAEAEAPGDLPRVSASLLDVRTTPAGAAGPEGAAPAIRHVSDATGTGTRSPGPRGRLLRVAAREGGTAMEIGPKALTVVPGTTVITDIAIDHLNRLVTPFKNPVVHTVSGASTSVDGRVVYVATATEEPVSLFISDGQNNDQALSLTLAPRFIPPREIRLNVPGYRDPGSASTPPGSKSDAKGAALPHGAMAMLPSAGYTETLIDLLRAMAQRRLPAGYQVSGSGPTVRCPTFKVLRTQLTEGPAGRVLTVGLRNPTTRTLTADEVACDAEPGVVAAIAAWPLREVPPGGETELFLALGEGTVGAASGGRPR